MLGLQRLNPSSATAEEREHEILLANSIDVVGDFAVAEQKQPLQVLGHFPRIVDVDTKVVEITIHPLLDLIYVFKLVFEGAQFMLRRL